MPCYARACRQVRPCVSMRICERHWHLCDISRFLHGPHSKCDLCGALWTRDDHGFWHRDRLEG